MSSTRKKIQNRGIKGACVAHLTAFNTSVLGLFYVAHISNKGGKNVSHQG